MKNKKIYVVIEDWACDYENGNSVVVFSSLDKATNYMQERIKECKQEYDYEIIEEDELTFSAYNEGYYLNNHTDIRIEEQEIDKWEV